MRRAFSVYCHPLSVLSIVFSDSAGKATAACFRSANDAGFKVTFKDFRAKRAPGLDFHFHSTLKKPDFPYRPEDCK